MPLPVHHPLSAGAAFLAARSLPLRALFLTFSLGLLAACAPLQTENAAAPAVSADLSSAAPAAYVYRVSPGDELNFRFFYTPSLNTTATVRADGRLALPLAGELPVAGLTTAELSTRIETALSATVRRPQVTVNVMGTGSQRIFVGGEVSKPGVQPMLGGLSVLQALSVAEGLKDTAQPRHALVMRRGPQGERQVLKVDLAAALSGRDPAQDLALQPLDVLIVPRSGVSDMNLWIDQYIRRMLPFNTGFSYTINRNGALQ